jgi:O-antigen/teichoic acid export membrane protein
LWVKAASFGSQVALGYLLSDGEWGVYAVAISIAAFVTAFRDGGVLELLVQRGKASYSDLREAVFSMALATNVGLGLILSVLAPVAGRFYGKPDVAPLLWAMAIALVLSTPAALLRAKLRIDLRFDVYARVSVGSALLHYGGVVVFALLDQGPLSFVLPLPIVALFEWLVLVVVTNERVWPGRLATARWPQLVRQVKWLLAGATAMIVTTMGDYAVLGRIVSTEVVGVYYFAFQLSVHVAMLAATNLGTVLMPSLASIVDDVPRQRRAVLRTIRSLGLVVAPLSLGLAAVIEPLEWLIWGGKWQPAVPAVQLLCLMLPLRMTFAVATSLLKSRGEFRQWAGIATAYGIGLVVVAAVAGSRSGEVSEIAAWIAGYFCLASPIVLYIAVRRVGVTVTDVLTTMLPAWVVATLCGVSCIGFDVYVLASQPVLLRVLVVGVLFLGLFAMTARTVLIRSLNDTLSVLPPILERWGTRIFRLRGMDSQRGEER